jgi:hypothetical protein
VVLVDGQDWVGGVTAALLAARTLAPVLLTAGDALPAATAAHLAAAAPEDRPAVLCTPAVAAAACTAAAGR